MVERAITKNNPINQDRLTHIREVIGSGPVLITTHDSPDPDALASGKAFADLLHLAWGISSKLVYSGLVARAENYAMLNLLTPAWEHAEKLTGLDRYPAVALVDTQPGAGNNSLPESTIPQIVIDHHHPLRDAINASPYVDVRPAVGATSSMLYQYLEAAGIVPDSLLATALFYGLHTDTNGLARGATPTDEFVYMQLLPLIDRQKLIQVEGAGVSREYFRSMSQGLQAARIYGRSVTAYLGEMYRPDLAAEMADVFIRLKNAQAVLCIGYHDQMLYLSLRTKPSGLDAGTIIQGIVFSLGKAGGHGKMAGGQVPLNGKNIDELVAQIESRFLDVMDEEKGGDLLLGN